VGYPGTKPVAPTTNTDVASPGGQFDVLTIGSYETPIWARRDWLKPLDIPASYDVNGLRKPIREGLSNNGKLYAVPFYGESSMLYYRKDLFQKAGIRVPEQPTYPQLREWASKVHQPMEIAAGSVIALGFVAANHDLEKFDSPEVFDITGTSNEHLGFSSGIHFCLGAVLARMELTICLTALLRRLPNLCFDPDKQAIPTKHSTLVLKGFDSLPVKFDARLK
jgi:hypothetical protein